MDVIRKQKQQYLRTEIIEQGYEPSEFQAYCKSLREDGDNIDVWTFVQLQQIVTDFVHSNYNSHQHQQETYENNQYTEQPQEQTQSQQLQQNQKKYVQEQQQQEEDYFSDNQENKRQHSSPSPKTLSPKLKHNSQQNQNQNQEEFQSQSQQQQKQNIKNEHIFDEQKEIEAFNDYVKSKQQPEGNTLNQFANFGGEFMIGSNQFDVSNLQHDFDDFEEFQAADVVAQKRSIHQRPPPPIAQQQQNQQMLNQNQQQNSNKIQLQNKKNNNQKQPSVGNLDIFSDDYPHNEQQQINNKQQKKNNQNQSQNKGQNLTEIMMDNNNNIASINVPPPDVAQNQQQMANAQIPEEQSQQFAQPNLDKLNEEVYHRTINCSKIDNFVDNLNQNFEISISKYIIKEGGMFSRDYVVYQINTKPNEWEVTRRFSEFDWLRKTLQRIFPTTIIPPISQKRGRNLNKTFLIKRMKFLERMLNNIMKCDELRCCSVVLDFLKIADDKIFQQKMKDVDKNLKKPEKLNQVQNVSGELVIEISQNLKDFHSEYEEYLNISDVTYKKVRKLCKQLKMDYENIAQRMYQLGECFSQLYNQTSTMNKKLFEDGKNCAIDDIYLNLNNLVVKWGKTFEDEIQIIDDNFCNFFKYQQHEIKSMKELSKLKQDARLHYYRQLERLFQKKEKVFSQNDPSKWEINIDNSNKAAIQKAVANKTEAFNLMLPKETQFTNQLKENYGFYNHACFQETKRSMDIKISNYTDHLLNFCRTHTINMTECHLLWADTMSKLAETQILFNQQQQKLQLQKNKHLQQSSSQQKHQILDPQKKKQQ